MPKATIVSRIAQTPICLASATKAVLVDFAVAVFNEIVPPAQASSFKTSQSRVSPQGCGKSRGV